ncbi:hypothetical protein E0H32_13685 [Rhizobium leguminosarum bv. viciae]|nr:hypothetical protein E0H32_13685 [Rhizobium leguminosarum bv. viciae]
MAATALNGEYRASRPSAPSRNDHLDVVDAGIVRLKMEPRFTDRPIAAFVVLSIQFPPSRSNHGDVFGWPQEDERIDMITQTNSGILLVVSL